jgi:CheY-like chemotaxis protein
MKQPDCKRILLVDDEAFTLDLLRLALPPSHYELSYVNSATAALAAVYDGQPDLVLLDVVMPGMSGLDVCRLLKNTPETSHIPVIMLSGLDSKADLAEASRAGACGYICKPITITDLQWQIESHLQCA